MDNDFDQEDPLGILTDKKPKKTAKDPLGILTPEVKKKETSSGGFLGGVQAGVSSGQLPEKRVEEGVLKGVRYVEPTPFSERLISMGVEGTIFDEKDPVKSVAAPIRNRLSSIRQQRMGIESVGQDKKAKEVASAEVTDLLTKKREIENLKFGNAVEAEVFLKQQLDPTKLATNKKLDITKQPTLDDFTPESIAAAIPKFNETAQIAAKQYLDNRAIREALVNSNSLEQAALKASINKGDLVGKQLEELEGNIPNAMKGNIMLNFLQDDNLQELAKKNPELNNQLMAEYEKFPSKYPMAAIRILAEKVSEIRESRGDNNALLNLPGQRKTDKIVNELIESGQLPPNWKKFYDNETVRILVNSNLKTPGLIENLGQGFEQGVTGIGKSVAELTGIRDIYKSPQEKLYDELGRQYSNVGFRPKGILHEVSTSGGLVTGQVLPMALGGNLLRAAKLVQSDKAANMIMAGMQTFGHNRDRAIADLPGASTAMQLSKATIDTGIEMALANVLNDTKLARTLVGKSSDRVKDVLNKFTQKEISAAAAKSEITNIYKELLGDAPKFIKGAAKTGVAEANEEAATEILQTANNQIFGGEPIKFSQAASEAFEVWRTTLLGTPFLGLAGGRAEVLKNPETSRLVYEMASNPEKYREIIQGQASVDNDYAKDLNKKLENLDYISQVKSELDSRPQLSELQKEKFLIQSLNQKMLQEKSDTIPDKTLKKGTDELIKESETAKEEILAEKPKEEISGHMKFGEETRRADLIQDAKSLSEDLDEVNRNAFNADPEQFLREAAEQLNASPSESARARKTYGDPISDIAIELFPDAKVETSPEMQALLAQEKDTPSGIETTQTEEIIPEKVQETTTEEGVGGRGDVVEEVKKNKELTLTAKQWADIVRNNYKNVPHFDATSNEVKSLKDKIEKEGYKTFDDENKLRGKINAKGEFSLTDGNHRIIALESIDPGQKITVPIEFVDGDIVIEAGGRKLKSPTTNLVDFLKQPQANETSPSSVKGVEGSEVVGRGDAVKALKVYPELKNTKVVNDDGTPKVVYHGGRNFDGFKIPESEIDKGIYFTDNPDFALYFAHQAELLERDKRGDDYSDIPNDILESGEPFPEKYLKYAKLHKAYLDMKNPKIVDAIDAASIPKNYEKDKDGFIAKTTGDFGYSGGQYVVFDPQQIKNADLKSVENENITNTKEQESKIQAVQPMANEKGSKQIKKDVPITPSNETSPIQEATQSPQSKPSIQEGQATEGIAEPTSKAKKAKEIADKVRGLKIKLGDGGLQSNVLGLPIGVWNAAMDIVAKTIEAGGTVADAIKRGLNHIQKNHRGQWDKKGFNDQVMKELGVRGITVNGEDLVVKDVDREFAETINGFYSDLEQTILDVSPTDRATPQAWLSKIGKGDEAKWTGVTDWLNSLPKDQKVTRKEILDWLKDNRIQVVEVVKEDKPLKESKEWIDLNREIVDIGVDIQKAQNKWYETKDDKDFDAIQELKSKQEKLIPKLTALEKKDREPLTKFFQYQLEGEKSNYKEVLVTLPVREVNPEIAGKKYYENFLRKGGDKSWEELSNKERAGITVKVPDFGKKEDAQFKSTHFDEPNILVHLRMNTRTDADGKKVLFLEEVQSDWGQKGKKEGFKGDKKIDDFIYKQVEDGRFTLNQLIDKNGNVVFELPYSKSKSDNPFTKEYLFKEYVDSIAIRMLEADKTPTAPFVTETPSWTKLGLKVALKEAVKQGADKIAWTTGEQQVKRYENELRGEVDKIEWEKNNDQEQVKIVATKGDGEKFNAWLPFKGKQFVNKYGKEIELEEIVGKEMANQILSSDKTTGKFEGDNLVVGGKGMKGFYGSPSEGKLGIVGEVAKSLFKQEPGTTTIKLDSGKPRNEFAENAVRDELPNVKNASTQHSITITPELKQEAETGLPLFKDIKGRGKEIADKLRKAKIKASGLQSNIAGIPVALYNAAIDTIALAIEGSATLTQAIQKAINKHKLNKQPKFNQQEFIKKLEDATGEKFLAEPPSPPTEAEGTAAAFVQRPGTELSFRGLQNVANEFGLEDVESRERKSDIQLYQDARNTINDWVDKGEYSKNIERLLKGVENGTLSLLDEQRVILQQHLANEAQKLRSIADKNSQEFETQFQYVKRLKEVGQKARQEAGAALRIPIGGASHPITDYADAMVAMAEASSVETLTEEQKAEVEKLVISYEEKARIAEEKLADVEAKFAALQAEKEVGNVRKKAKKTNKDYAAERKQIVDDIREKLKKARQETTATVIPYAKELIAIAPDVAKLVKNLVEQGVTNLAEIVTEVYEVLKADIPDIREKDVHDIIAGEYSKKKPTKTELQRQLEDLKIEASLMNRLDKLLAGEVPKNEKAKVERNRRIKELRDKIAEVTRGEKLPEDAVKLKQAITRSESKAKELREKINKGDFEKVEKPTSWVNDSELKKKFPKLYNQALDALAAKEQAQLDFDIALYKAERAKRNKAQKGIDLARALIATTKAIKSGIDDSAVMMQNVVAMIAHPRSAAKALREHALDAISERRFRRYLTELHQSPIWDLMVKSGLDITDPKSLQEQNKEEIFDNNLLNKDIKIKGKKYNIGKYLTRPFERAFTSLGNAMRVNMFTRIAERMMQEGKTFESHPQEFKDLARVLNTETGRGRLHTQIQRASQLVTAGIWSPRLMASRLNMLGISDIGAPLYGGKGYYAGLTKEARKLAAYDMVKFIGAGVALMALAGSQGADVDDDPESPTFGTIQLGNKKYNTWGGFTPYVKTIVSGITGKRNIRGERVPVTRGKLIGTFFRSRLTPAAGVTTNLLVGKDFSGQPVTPMGELRNLVAPISIESIIEATNKDGAIGLLTHGLPSFIGVGVSDERDFPEVPKNTFEIKYEKTDGTYGKRQPTEKEYKEFKELSNTKYQELLSELKSTEVFIDRYGDISLDEDEEGTTKPYEKLTKDESKKLDQKLKAKASREAKKELFGEQNE